MDDPLELQSTVNFVLENEKHFDVAARIAKAFPVARRQVAMNLLDALELKLAGALGPGWSIYNCKNELFVANYPGFSVWGESWGDKICLNLENQTRAGGTVVGIWRENKPANTALDDALTEAFAKEAISGHRNRWWAWYKFLPPEYGDWNQAPALIAMHLRQMEVVEAITFEMMRVRRIAAPIVEAFVAGE